MRLVFAGTPEVAVPSLRRLLESSHQVVGVLTRPDARAGRGRRMLPSPVRVVAEEAGVPVFTPASLRDDEIAGVLAELSPDCCPVVAYGTLVPPGLLTLPRCGWVNLHFSRLPAWRGAAPVQRSIIAGDEVTGASVFQLEVGMDTGPVFASVDEPIRTDDTAGDLLTRLAETGAELLVSVLDHVEAGSITATPQPAGGVSLAPKIEVDDARVSWDAPGAVVDRLIRGCTPAPGAWTTFRGERIKLDPVRPVGGGGAGGQRVPPQPMPPGTVPLGTVPLGPVPLETVTFGTVPPGTLDVTSKRVLVWTGDGQVELGVVRAAGKKPMPAADWARGARPEPGEAFQ